jgi:antitoxin component of MazEF toxin-antitoxin module
MIKHLTTHGNSLALIIEKAILELLHITQNTPLEINTDGRNLIISPVEDAKQEKKFRETLAKVNKKYEKTLRALAG